MIKAMQEQEAKIENQEYRIEALTQLVNKLSQNPDAAETELTRGLSGSEYSPPGRLKRKKDKG